jgi:2-dehydropantoate 2-reductase
MINKISLIGLGGIGAAYASKLHDMNPDCLQVIANKERNERYKEQGIHINGKRYDFTYIHPEVKTEPADLILIAVKYEGLDQAIEEMRHHIGPNTIIMSLMNGISSEEIIGYQFGSENLLYAMCVAIDAVREGTSITFSNIGRICFSEKENIQLSPKVQKVRELFDRASIPYEIPEDMLHAMWWKFMINVGINQTSAVLNAPYQVFQEIPEAHEFMYSAMEEVIKIAQKIGIRLTNEDFKRFDKILKEGLAPEGKTSMLQDIEAGRKTEVEYLAGTVCTLGKEHNVPTPVNDMLLKIIHVLEKKNDHFS